MACPSRSVLRKMIGYFLLLTQAALCAIALQLPSFPSVPFDQPYTISWNPDNVNLSSDGSSIVLTLDQQGGSGYASKKMYTFGYISTAIKLAAGDSAGTVTAYYLSSDPNGQNHDELDFEFLGNRSGQPYVLQTNVFANGVGGREQRIVLWFDPTAEHHTYSVLWNAAIIVFSVDGIPIREFKNNKQLGVDYPLSKPMGIYSTIWNGEKWATEGGHQKIDWTQAPFAASFKTFIVDACVNDAVFNNSASFVTDSSGHGEFIALGINKNTTTDAPLVPCWAEKRWWSGTKYRGLTLHLLKQLQMVKRKYMIYDYCVDSSRYPVTPTECATN